MHDFKFTKAAGIALMTMSAFSSSLAQSSHTISLLSEFRPIGGTGNNLVNPKLNAMPGSPELILAPLNFALGTTDGLVTGPNPRLISNVIAGGTGANGQDSQTPDPSASAWLYVFGQFVDHDISLERSLDTGQAIDIEIPPNDPTFSAGTKIAMTRDLKNPETNTAINTVAGYLDLSQLYGSTVTIADSLRNPDGTLKSSNEGQALPIENDRFITGDQRVMENPELTAVTTLFMREHNRWVDRIKAQNPGWSGDQLYNMAKAIVTAEYQTIVYREYLPVLIGPVLTPYKGYDPNVNAQVTQEFSTAAFRVGHTQVSETQIGVDNRGMETFSQSLGEAFFNTATEDLANGFNPLMRNLSRELSQATDVYTVPVLRNLLFAPLAGGNIDQLDLIAIDIQRERDVGLGTLNQTRKVMGLPVYSSFAELTADPVLQQDFQSVYGSIDSVDLFMGGLAESHSDGAAVGQTFQTIIKTQFDALRSGDRFYWENQDFDPETRKTIAATTLANVLKRNTDTQALQANVFIVDAPAPVARAHAKLRIVDTHGRRGRPFMAP